MLRNLLISGFALLAMASCQSTGTEAPADVTPGAISQALQASAQANGADVQKAFAANQPLLLVFWQAW